MINNPGLPNAAMTRWISYILLFDFEIQHAPATKHKGPDGLLHHGQMEEDSEASSSESDISNIIRLIKVPKDS
jgi:hypothetical protein